MKHRIIAAIVRLTVLTHAAFAQTSGVNTITLKQCVDAAIQNNLQVRQSDLQMQAAGVTLSQSKANMLPDLTGNLGHGFNQGRSIDPFTNSYINQQIAYANYSL